MSFTLRFKSHEVSGSVKSEATDSVRAIDSKPGKKPTAKPSKKKCDKCGCTCDGGSGGVVVQNVLNPGPDSWLTFSTTADPLNSDFYLIDATSGSITLTFPDASTQDGQSCYVKRVDTASGNTVTLDTGVLGQTIDGTTSVSLNPGDSRFVVSGNGNWW